MIESVAPEAQESEEEQETFTFTHSTHVRLNKKKPEQVYAVKTLKRGLLAEIKEKCRIRLVVSDPKENFLSIQLSNCDVSIANALRRLMLSYVPSVAIDDVYVLNNTGVMQDEMLAHRLGLIPIYHPGIAEFKNYDKTKDGAESVKNSDNTLVFRLNVKCEVSDLRIGRHDCLYKPITSADLKWIPQGEAQEQLPPELRPRCTLDDIVITQLGLNQSMEIEAHAIKGIGALHAKWSPVATATYRMFPEIRFKNPKKGVTGELAKSLVRLHPDIFELKEGNADGSLSENEYGSYHLY